MKIRLYTASGVFITEEDIPEFSDIIRWGERYFVATTYSKRYKEASVHTVVFKTGLVNHGSSSISDNGSGSSFTK